MAMFPMTLGDL